MAVYHGKDAKIDFSGSLIAATIAWSLSPISDVAESTVMGDSWQDFEAGYTDFTVSVDGNARTTRATITQLGSEATLKLYLDSTNYFSANVICTGITEVASKDDIGKITYTLCMVKENNYGRSQLPWKVQSCLLET
ncbi:hypothetical protein LCGC14_2195810 [marine sediment metagenome]|uniref:Uncharacterized protein n=1 Tax=marine sediment metagenome TaxID=412755 RepID=A0A0F9DI72_9ZZZZ